jgi:hypothetical protein
MSFKNPDKLKKKKKPVLKVTPQPVKADGPNPAKKAK